MVRGEVRTKILPGVERIEVGASNRDQPIRLDVFDQEIGIPRSEQGKTSFFASTTIWFTRREVVLRKTMTRPLNGTWRRSLCVLPLELK